MTWNHADATTTREHPAARPDRRSRVRGSLLGGAIGDALGGAVESESLDEIRGRFGGDGITDFAPAFGRRGAITDDTQMMLFTADGLIRSRYLGDRATEVDVRQALRRAYLRWLDTQERTHVTAADDQAAGWLGRQMFLYARRSPESTCLSALHNGGRGTVSRPTNDSKDNAGVVRVAPIGLVVDEPFQAAVDAAALTHGHPSGYLAAGAFAELIAQLVQGATVEQAAWAARSRTSVEGGSVEVVDALDQAMALAADSSVSVTDAIAKLGEGWVADEALAIAVYCSLVADDIRQGLVYAVNHDGDSACTGSMTGTILGALLGDAELPLDLVSELEGAYVIEQVADDLASDDRPNLLRYPPG